MGPLVVLLLLVLLLATALPVRAAVTAEPRGGTLVLRGDDAADAIEIDGDLFGSRQVRVTPVLGTTLNGGTATLTFDPPTDLDIDLGAGDNAIDVIALGLPGRFVDHGGAGSDGLFFHETTLGAITADLGDGDNALELSSGTLVTGDVRVTTGDGDDRVDYDNPSSVVGSTRADLGGGDDLFTAFDSGAGPIVVRAGAGDDKVWIFGAGVGPVRVDLGAGDDEFATARGARIGGDLVVNAGTGDDHVTLGAIDIDGRVTVTLGAGDDVFATSLFAGVGRDIDVRAGDGADTFDLRDLEVMGDGRFDGGAGPTTFAMDEACHFDTLAFRGHGAVDLVDIRGFLQVARDARFTLAGGDDAVTIQEAVFDGDLVVRTGAGNDTVSVLETVTVAGKTVIEP